jgi:hypothetical protein
MNNIRFERIHELMQLPYKAVPTSEAVNTGEGDMVRQLCYYELEGM